MKKRALSLLLTLVMMVSLLPNAFAAKQATFTDVSEDMWCFDYVEYVARQGYFKGTTATTFNPNGTMTRQQFVTVLARMAGVKVDNSKTAFSDVPADSYSAGSVAWAAKNGIVTGYADGTFKPTDPVTRQQMCAFMSRFMDWYAEENDVYFLKRTTVSGFADYAQVADYAKSAVDRCRTYGLIQGYAEDNTFRPTNSATRAHVAAVIYRLDLIIEAAGGGSTGSKGTTYTLTYVNENVPAGTATTTKDTKTVKANSYTFTVKADPTELNNKAFLNWTDGTTTYVAGDQITLVKAAPSKTITANWADKNDLLYLAIGNTANYILSEGQAKANEVNNVVAPYASLNTLTIAAPSTIDTTDNSRTINIGAEVELSTDIISRMIETATYYAVKVIGSPAYFTASGVAATDPITKADVREIVAELLDVLDPTQVWWTGASRAEKIQNLADKIYTTLMAEGKEHAGFLWNEYYKYNGAALFTEVALEDNGAVVVKAKNDKKLYDAADNQLSYKKGVAYVARAMGKQLYASLQANTTYVTDLCLNGELALEFTMNPAQNIAATTAGYPTTYYVAADLDLIQGGAEDYLAYKFEGGRSYVKLIATANLQADYEQSVNAIAEAALTNAAAKAALKDAVMAKLDASIASMPELVNKIEAYDLAVDGEAYIKAKLSAGVDNWIEENLDTRASGTAPYYLPFDFFWTLGGKVDANGNILAGTGIDTTRHLFNNDDLTSAISAMVDEVIAAVLNKDYGIVLGANETLTDGVKRVIETKIQSGVNKTAVQNTIETLAEDKIVDGLEDVIASTGPMASYLADQVAGFFEAAFGCTITNAATTPTVSNLTVDGIDTFLSTVYDTSDPADPNYSRNVSFSDLQDVLSDAIDTELTTSMSSVLTGNVATLIGGNAAAQTYLKNEVLTYIGFDGHANKAYPVADKDQVIDDLVQNVLNSYGVDSASLNATLEAEIAKAAGAYSTYLNKVGVVSSFDALTTVKLQNLVSVMKNATVLNMLDGVAPSYVEAIAAVIGKIEGNPSSITINGVTVNGMSAKVQAIKAADDARELCLAVADFLGQWGDLSISSFAEPGVPVDVVASYGATTYDFGVNFVIEVQ